MFQPSVCRIVQYRERAYNRDTDTWGDVGEPRPAIIGKVHSDSCVDLHVFFNDPKRMPVEVRTSVVYDDAEIPSGTQTWRWPPRG